jgi:hypothetical protein
MMTQSFGNDVNKEFIASYSGLYKELTDLSMVAGELVKMLIESGRCPVRPTSLCPVTSTVPIRCVKPECASCIVIEARRRAKL